MNNKNSGTEYKNFYEDKHGGRKNKNYNFDFEIDIDKADECFIDSMENADNEDCGEVYKEGFKDGYEKAKLEVLVYMKKNKCCIRCKRKSKLRSK